jgi:hypothetical protein
MNKKKRAAPSKQRPRDGGHRFAAACVGFDEFRRTPGIVEADRFL